MGKSRRIKWHGKIKSAFKINFSPQEVPKFEDLFCVKRDLIKIKKSQKLLFALHSLESIL